MDKKIVEVINKHRTEEYTKLKVLEEMAELSEVLLKNMTKDEEDRPPKSKIIEEAGDVLVRIVLLSEKMGIADKIDERINYKLKQIYEWTEKNKK